MDTFNFIDIYATKGIEYLVVIAFMVSIVFFHRYFVMERKTAGAAREGLFALLARKAHLTEMRWNPVMAYMRQPRKKTTEQKTPTDKK